MHHAVRRALVDEDWSAPSTGLLARSFMGAAQRTEWHWARDSSSMLEEQAALLEHLVASAQERGVQEVRLRPMYQVEGEAFYARCGFRADADDDASDDRVLRFCAAGEAAEAAAEAEADDEHSGGEAAETGLAPAGFEWGATY